MKKTALLILVTVFVFAFGFGSAVTTQAGPPCIIGDYYWVVSAGCCSEWYIHVKYCNGVTIYGEPCGHCEWRCEYSRICAPKTPNIK